MSSTTPEPAAKPATEPKGYIRLEHTGTDQKDLGTFYKGEPEVPKGSTDAKPLPARYPAGTPKHRIFLGSTEDDNDEARASGTVQPVVVVPAWAWEKAKVLAPVRRWLRDAVIRAFPATADEATKAAADEAKAKAAQA